MFELSITQLQFYLGIDFISTSYFFCLFVHNILSVSLTF